MAGHDHPLIPSHPQSAATSCEISIHALEYTLATLVKGVASALRHQPFEQGSHDFYPTHPLIQLRKLSLRQRPPTHRRSSNITETKEQLADFAQ